MPFRDSIHSREFDKFVETADNETAVRVVAQPPNINFDGTFSGTGVVLATQNVKDKELLTVEVTDVDPTNQVQIKGRLINGTYKPIWNIIGPAPARAFNISKWDEIEVEVIVFSTSGTPGILVSTQDSGHAPEEEDQVVTFTENSIDYTANAKEPTADQSHPVWKVKREFTTSGETISQLADGNNYTQVLADRNTIFPPAPLINQKSLLYGGVDEFCTAPTNAATDFDFTTEPATFSMWAKRATGITAMTLFANLNLADNPTFPGYSFFGSTSSMTGLMISDNSATETINKTFTVTGLVGNNTWHHYCFTYDGSGLASGLNFYLDGTLLSGTVGVDNLTTTTANGNPMLMANSFTGLPLFLWVGNQDEAAILNIEWTQAHVTEHYNEGKPSDLLVHSSVLADPTRLLAYYRLGDDAGDVFPTIANLGDVGNAIDMTMTNMEATDIVDDVP